MRNNCFISFAVLAIIILTFSGCTLHFPPYDYVDYNDCRVILLVDPDDSEVLLDGKLIGEAYEFSTAKSALRLSTKHHELIIKKEGFTEEVVNLKDYDSWEITLRITMEKDNDYRPDTVVRKERRAKPEKQRPEKVRPEYTSKTVTEKEPPKLEAEEREVVKFVNVTLEVQPAEASIYINGKFWGLAPENGKIENLRLKSGKYTVVVFKPGFKEMKKVLDIKDKDLNIRFKLQK